LDIVHRVGTLVPTLINASRTEYDGMEFDELAVLVVVERHKYERELLRARERAELALEAQRQAESALRHADRRKDEFLAMLAHELRNPLAPMQNILELFRLQPFADPQLTWGREVLERQVGHMTHLVDDLLEVARITQGKLELRRRRIELATAMQGAVEASRPLILAASHELVVTFPTEPIVLDADPIRLSQMIQNLLNNAAKYTPPGGRIGLHAERDGEQAVISVRDSGIGISQEHLSTVFEMFSQLEPALERTQGGLGIGLSLVRALAGLHGGSVEAASAGAGHGSEFTVRLPTGRHDGVLQADERGQRVGGTRKRRIAIVDDNEDAAMSLGAVLKLEGHDIHTAFLGGPGLELARDVAADAVILDIGLPDINGYEVARRIRREPWGRETLLIALTGWGQEQDKRDAAAAGFDHHFTKPANLEELLMLLG
jgi:signal transduction histidine kinase